MARFGLTFGIPFLVVGIALTCAPAPTLALRPHPCTGSQQRVIMRIVSRFSRALFRDDMQTVNHLTTAALRARARSKQVQRFIHPKTEQAALSFMLNGSDPHGSPARPVGFRFLPDRLLSYGQSPLRTNIELFYRWPGAGLSVVGLVHLAGGWRISVLRIAQV